MATIRKNFNSTWREGIDKNVLTKCKKILDCVLLQITPIDNLQDITLIKVLESSNIKEYHYYKAVKIVQKKVGIYKRNPFEVNI